MTLVSDRVRPQLKWALRISDNLMMGYATKFLLTLLLFLSGILLGGYFTNRVGPDRIQNVHVRFLIEIFDEVKEVYWKKVDEKKLAILFKDAVANYVDQPQAIDQPARQDIVELLRMHIRQISDDEDKKKFVVQVGQNFLNSLQPAKRSKLFNNESLEKLADAVNKPSTIFSSKVHSSILYLRIKSFSPNTPTELVKHFDIYSADIPLNTLIIDLRSNTGGAISSLPEILGIFIGKNQYAYEFQSKDVTTPYKTTKARPKSMDKYKKIVIFVNQQTQSTAELTASVFKRFNLGVLVGVKTAGWATVERIQKIQQELDVGEYNSLYVVHALMLGQDGTPIEGRGVLPDIDISKNGWDKQLFEYFNQQFLAHAVRQLWQNPPSEKQ